MHGVVCTLDGMEPTKVTRKSQGQSGTHYRALEIRAGSWNPETRTFSATFAAGATFRRRSWTGEEWDECLSMDPAHVRMGRLQAGASLLDDHNQYNGVRGVLGRILPGTAKLESGKITAEIQLSRREDVKGIAQDVADGILDKTSLGYKVYKWLIDRSVSPERRTAVDWEPWEGSLVQINADVGAVVRNGNQEETNLVELEIIERGANMEPNAITPATPAVPATQPDASRAAPVVDAQAVAVEATRKENLRSTGIRDLAKRHGIDEATVNKWTGDTSISIDQVRGLVLEELAKRSGATPAVDPTNPAPTVVVTRAEGSHLNKGMTDALLHRADPAKYKLTDEGRALRGMSLTRMMEELVRRSGGNVAGLSRDQIIDRGLLVRSGEHTTSDFPSITENVFGKLLRDQYAETPDTTAGWTRRVPLPDFKTVSRVQLGAMPSLAEVPEAGAITYATLGETKESYALKQYARGFNLSRILIQNDDTNAFSRAAQLMGAAARRLELDLVYFGILNANPAMADAVTLFHASSHGANLITPALAIATLNTMRAKMRKQTGQAGETLNLEPKFLLVGADSEMAAWQLIYGEILATAVTSANPFKGKLTLVVEPRLGNTAQSGTAGACVVTCDPSQCDTIEIGYLADEPGPIIASMLDFETRGVKYGCWHDAAAKAIDYRGMIKTSGTT